MKALRPPKPTLKIRYHILLLIPRDIILCFIAVKELDELPSGQRIQILSNGTAYSCFIPVDADNKSSSSSTTQHTPADGTYNNIDNAVQSSRNFLPTPLQTLDSIGDWCAFRIEDWWTYEICYKKTARQYHADTSGALTQQYILGQYKNKEDAPPVASAPDAITTTGGDNGDNKSEIYTDESDVGRPPMKYVRHMYSDGDRCELSDDRRQVEVRYICDDDDRGDGAGGGSRGGGIADSMKKNGGQNEHSPTLVEVREPSSCSYLFVVSVPRLCEHPLLRESPGVLNEIPCYPHELREEDRIGGEPIEEKETIVPLFDDHDDELDDDDDVDFDDKQREYDNADEL